MYKGEIYYVIEFEATLNLISCLGFNPVIDVHNLFLEHFLAVGHRGRNVLKDTFVPTFPYTPEHNYCSFHPPCLCYLCALILWTAYDMSMVRGCCNSN